MKRFFTLIIVLCANIMPIIAQQVMPFAGFVDAPMIKPKPASAYPRTEIFWAYTLWDSVKVSITRTGQQRFGNYAYLWRTETGICQLGENEYATDDTKDSEGCYFLTKDTTVYFYNKNLKQQYNTLLHATSPKKSYALPTSFFQDMNTYNTRHLELGSIDDVRPIHIWIRQNGRIDSLRLWKGNVDADPETEQVLDIRFLKVDNKGYRTHKLLFLDKGADGKWYVRGAMEATSLNGVTFDKKNNIITIKRQIDRSGTGQIYSEVYTDMYRWTAADTTLSEKMSYMQERIHDYEIKSPYIFDRTEKTSHRFTDYNTIEVADSIGIGGTTRKHETRLDTTIYTWRADAHKFEETNATAWQRPPNYTWFDTSRFQVYTRWDSLPAIVIRKFGYEPTSRKAKFARVLQQSWYNIGGRDFPYNANECANLIKKTKYHYDDIYAYSCELREHLAKLSEPINSDTPIPIKDSMIYYINISKNLDTLNNLSPIQQFSHLIASKDSPDREETKKMEMWNIDIDGDPYKETIWWVWDSERVNGLLMIIDEISGSPYIVSIDDVIFFNKLPKPVVDTKNKLITIRCPRGKYETYKYFRYANNKLEQILEIEGAIEIGGLRQELDALPRVIDENTIEVDYIYNLFYEQSYPENEAMRLGFLNNIKTTATFTFDGTKFVCSKMSDNMPLLTETKASAVMAAFLKHNRATLEELKDKGEGSQKQLLKDYLEMYLAHFGL
jgi:hypothetical protein